jgi:hypothetical protein
MTAVGASPGKRWHLATVVAFALVATRASTARADNPIVQTSYTADPAPML